jgi:tRNA(fMet)-specific endonuclease VapC
MNGNVLLDTNIVIALFGSDQAVQANMKSAAEIFLSSTILGELFYGALHSDPIRLADNLARIHGFAASVDVLPCDLHTARHYGEIKAGLRKRGSPIPENDIWIAAIARQYGLTLVSRDAHFQAVPGLTILDWRS